MASRVDAESHPRHYAHLRRQLHPLLLSSPFANRAFNKPLGYAGDYQMVDMMIRPPFEGATLFAKIINVWLWGQSPAQAHRNRVDYLERKLFEGNGARRKPPGRAAQVLNLGCGPAEEVQRFFCETKHSRARHADAGGFQRGNSPPSARQAGHTSKSDVARPVSFRLIKKIRFQILKDGGASCLPRRDGRAIRLHLLRRAF